MYNEPWWSGGLHFSCLGCGRCCRGEPGAIYYSKTEEMRMAYCLGISTGEFRRRYTTDRWRLPSIGEKARGGECLFYSPDTSRCTIYPTRPLQCRTWPFWPELLSSRDNWEKAARGCPGMNWGKFHGAEEIETVLSGYNEYLSRLTL